MTTCLFILINSIRLHGQAVKTPPFHGGNRGSNPLGVIELNTRFNLCRHGSMAEQLICNQQVVGSTPTVGSIGPLAQLVRATGS